jgi:hypothetical protein
MLNRTRPVEKDLRKNLILLQDEGGLKVEDRPNRRRNPKFDDELN